MRGDSEKNYMDVYSHLEQIQELINQVLENDFNAESVKQAVWDYATKEGRGAVLWPMRVALSGKEKSPDPFILSEILGKEETLMRLHNATKI